MSLRERIQNMLGRKYPVSTDTKIPQKSTPIKEKKPKMIPKIITRKVPTRYIVAHKNCAVCKGTGNIAPSKDDTIPCMCRRLKRANSPKWSRKYWNVLSIYTEKEVKQKIMVPEEKAKKDKK